MINQAAVLRIAQRKFFCLITFSLTRRVVVVYQWMRAFTSYLQYLGTDLDLCVWKGALGLVEKSQIYGETQATWQLQ